MQATEVGAISQPAPRPLGVARPRWGERIIRAILFGCALLSVVTTVAILVALLQPTIEFFGEVRLREFFFTREWAPLFEPPSFGVPPLILATLTTTACALVVCLPFGLGAAIYLSEYARPNARRVLKPLLEILAGIPTVVYGFFALTFVTPLLQDVWPGFLGEKPNIFNAGAAGLAIGLLIVPIIASISEDAMSSVPGGLREGAYALGSSRMKVALRVVFPAALSGIAASIVLGFSRAVGETMVVLMAAGSTPNLTLSPTESIQAMTSYIGVTATGDISTGTIEYDTIFAVGLLLFVITLFMNLISIRLVRRFREVYE